MIPTSSDKPSSNSSPSITPARTSLVVLIVLIFSSWIYILTDNHSGFGDLLMSETWGQTRSFFVDLTGLGKDTPPAYLRSENWLEAFHLAYKTLAMSILAIGIATCLCLVTFVPGARNLAFGDLAISQSNIWKTLYFTLRGVFIMTRGIPELIIAMIIVFFLAPGILPGAVALGIHNYGILGKLSAEIVENMDTRPVRALRSSGASSFQLFAYGILPQVLPQFLTYILYRWEVVIRTTIVVGLVSAGGLGREFRLDMSFFRYTEIALLLFWYMILVALVDFTSMYLRRLAK